MPIEDDIGLSEDSQDASQDYKKRSRKRKVYCLCRTDRDTAMIQCDGCLEWFHLDCVKIDDDVLNRIDKYFCPLCRGDRSPIVYKKSKASASVSAEKSNDILVNFKSKNHDEEHDNYSPDDDDDDDDDEEFRISNTEKKSKKKYRKSETKNRRSTPKKNTQKRGRRKGHSNKENKTKGKGRKKTTNKSQQHRRSRYKSVSDDSQDEQIKNEGPRQCYGPGCIQAARKGSKYCSDECGIRLATDRITKILPGRIPDSQNVSCDADLRSVQELQQIREELNLSNDAVIQTVAKRNEVQELITRAKQTPPYTAEEAEEVLSREDFEYYVSCCICSSEISIKQIMRHTERCMAKCESRHVYGCTVRIANPYDLFCDTYSPKDKTYCRRLRVICTEHQKDTKDKDKTQSEDEVCGCPVPTEETLFEEATDNFCRLPRKQCYVHHGWEKYRIAVVDFLLLSHMIRVDDLITREQKVTQMMRQRHGLVPLMLHQTIDANKLINSNQQQPGISPQ